MKCNRCDKPQRVVIKGERLCWDCYDEVKKAEKDTGPLGYPFGFTGV
jgi:hypothetical protein